MLPQPISRSQDFLDLRALGYTVSVQSGFLVVDNIPCVVSRDRVGAGRMFCPLAHNGGQFLPPNTHVMQWAGPEPLDQHGNRLRCFHSVAPKEHAPGLSSDFQFSNKIIENGKMRTYRSFKEMVETYARTFAAPATAIDNFATATPHRPVPNDDLDGSPFVYEDTASPRAGIVAAAARFHDQRVAIVGLGGTGAYILDLISKIPVAEIRLFDDDDLLQHNAFRSPGAVPFECLESKLKKVQYFTDVYSKMHRHIVPTPVRIVKDTLSLLNGCTFVFVAIDHAPSKVVIFDYLSASKVPFVDVGLGVNLLSDTELSAQLRVTLSDSAHRDHIAICVPLRGIAADNEYATNIQVSDLNALNAALAVVRWKRFFGFYQSTMADYHSLFRVRDGAHLRDEFKEDGDAED